VIVCKNDQPFPDGSTDPSGEIVFEVYTKDTRTREAAQEKLARFLKYGECRIGRVVFD